MIGRTADIAHRLGSTAAMTSLMFCVPASAASIDRWIARSQIPVRFDGARTSRAGAAADGLVVVAGAAPPVGGGVGVGETGVVASGAATSAGQL